MSKFTDLETRIRAVLEDQDTLRFSGPLLAAALRRALDDVDLQLPHIAELEVTATDASRDLALSGLAGCRYIIDITVEHRLLEPEANFTYFLKDGVPTLHFNGGYFPQAGDIFLVRYASGYTIEGFEGEGTTTLPAAFESALVNGTAAEACFLRAGSLAERYGTRPADPARLMEIGHLWRQTFVRSLSGLKAIQDFGFPPGFALDEWDKRRS